MIRPLVEENFERFFSYLKQQLLENGRNGPLFQPQSREDDLLPSDKMTSFINGLTRPISKPGWRRAWIAEGAAGDIIGHADLRARPEPHTAHRALLGMGVRRDVRRSGLGQELVNFILDWAKHTGAIEIVDLSVMSNNLPAIKLYEKLGFTTLCEIEDMFRIDGKSEGDTLMTKRL